MVKNKCPGNSQTQGPSLALPEMLLVLHKLCSGYFLFALRIIVIPSCSLFCFLLLLIKAYMKFRQPLLQPLSTVEAMAIISHKQKLTRRAHAITLEARNDQGQQPQGLVLFGTEVHRTQALQLPAQATAVYLAREKGNHVDELGWRCLLGNAAPLQVWVDLAGDQKHRFAKAYYNEKC